MTGCWSLKLRCPVEGHASTCLGKYRLDGSKTLIQPSTVVFHLVHQWREDARGILDGPRLPTSPIARPTPFRREHMQTCVREYSPASWGPLASCCEPVSVYVGGCVMCMRG